jgi:cupin 2 domain-containing protein
MDEPRQLLANLPPARGEEWFETLAQRGPLRIERIVSHGQSSPEGFWYDQAEREFVLLLAGHARLQVDDQEFELQPGSWCEIPPHCRHRVEWTDAAQATVWLAIFCAE